MNRQISKLLLSNLRRQMTTEEAVSGFDWASMLVSLALSTFRVNSCFLALKGQLATAKYQPLDGRGSCPEASSFAWPRRRRSVFLRQANGLPAQPRRSDTVHLHSGQIDAADVPLP